MIYLLLLLLLKLNDLLDQFEDVNLPAVFSHYPEAVVLWILTDSIARLELIRRNMLSKSCHTINIRNNRISLKVQIS